MAWIKLNATTPAAPEGAENVHFRQEAGHDGTQSDPIPTSAYLENLPFTDLADAPASYSGQGGLVVAVKADESGLEFIEASGGSLARTTAAINAGTLGAGASATGSVTMCKSGFLMKVVAVAKARLRLYKTVAGRDADAGRPIGVSAAGGIGLLAEILWLGTAPLTWPMQPDAILENDDGTPAATIYWAVTNEESSSTAQTFTLTYMGIES